MIYFFHHYELPVIIQQAQLQQIILQTRDGQVPNPPPAGSNRQQPPPQQQPQPQQPAAGQPAAAAPNGPQPQQQQQRVTVLEGLFNAIPFQRRNNDNNNNNRNILISIPRYYGFLSMNGNNNNNNGTLAFANGVPAALRNIAHSLFQSLRTNVAAGMELLGNMNMNLNNNNNLFAQRLRFGFGNVQNNRNHPLRIRIVGRSPAIIRPSPVSGAVLNPTNPTNATAGPMSTENIAASSAVDPRLNYQRNYEANNFIFPEAVLTQHQQQQQLHQEEHQELASNIDSVSDSNDADKIYNIESVGHQQASDANSGSSKLESTVAVVNSSLEPSSSSPVLDQRPLGSDSVSSIENGTSRSPAKAVLNASSEES